MLLIILIVLAALIVVGVALVAVGRVSGQLDSSVKQAIYDRAEAVDYVAELLPDDVTAQLSYDELAQLLQYHLDYLAAQGVAHAQGDEPLDPGPALASEDDALAYVIGRAADAGLVADDVWIAQVIAGNERYLRAIGAIGPEVD